MAIDIKLITKTIQPFLKHEICRFGDDQLRGRRSHAIDDPLQMARQRIRFGIIVEVKSVQSFRLQHQLVSFHCRAMQPQFLDVKLHRIPRITKEQAVFDQYDPRWLEFEAGMIGKQLMRENEQVQICLSRIHKGLNRIAK